MGKIFKFGCLAIVILIVAIIAIAAFNTGVDNTDPAATAPTKEEAKRASDEEVKPAEESKVTEENFDKIVEGDWDGSGGMTVEEVEAILGKPSQTMKSSTDGMEILDYTWMDGILGDTIQVSFSDGKVSFKMWMPESE